MAEIIEGAIDIASLGNEGWLKRYLRQTFFIDPIVRELKGYVLDIGCGLAPYLARYTDISLGIDACEANVGVCRRKGIQTIWADVNAFVQEKAFDTVLLAHVLEHLSEPNRALENAYLSTKIGGRIIVIVPGLVSFLVGLNNLVGHKQFINEQYVDYYLLRKGCRKLKSYTFPPFGFPYFSKYQELRLIYQVGR